MKLFFAYMFFLSALCFAVPAEVRNALTSGSARSIVHAAESTISQTLDAKTWQEDSLPALLENKELENTFHISKFFKNITKKGNCYIEALRDSKFCAFLLENPSIFQQLAESNRGNGSTLNVIREIWLNQGKKLEKIELTAALGCGLAMKYQQKDGMEKSLKLYEFYRTAKQNGNLFQQYDQLEAWEMAILFDHGRSTEDLAWGQNLSKSTSSFTAKTADRATQFIPYREKNKNGISIHAGAPFYDYKPTTLEILHEYGGVCGAVSKGAAGFLASRGVPAYPIGQPGHCAFVYKNLSGEWTIGNNIYGWVWSGGHSGFTLPDSANMSPWEGPPAMISSYTRFKQLKESRDSELCRAYAALSGNSSNRDFLLNQALEKAYGKNVVAWKDLISRQPKTLPLEQKFHLARKISSVFRKDPIAAQSLLDRLLPLNTKRPEKYRIIAQIIPEEGVEDVAVTLYMKAFSKCLEEAIPELKNKVSYNVHTRKNFYALWLTYLSSDQKVSLSLKKKTLAVLEQSITGLPPNSSESIQQLNFYLNCQKLWKDPRLIDSGNAFLKKLLATELSKDSDLGNALVETGLALSELSGNKRDLEYYLSIKK